MAKDKNTYTDAIEIFEDDAIVLDNVTKAYNDTKESKNSNVLKGISLRIKKGEFVFIVGDSGSGKSTLIKLLLRELTSTTGSVYVLGQNLNKLKHKKIPAFRRQLGVVFQDFRLLKSMNVYENVAFAQYITQVPEKEVRGNVKEMLQKVGLAGKYKSKPKQLSGGEQQRVALARALINKPDILLCDEPTGNLDPKNSWEIMKLLEDFNNEGTTVVVVTHNQEIVDSMQKRVITMHKGNVWSDEETGGYVYEN